MDDKLQNIFAEFNPSMSSEVDFMKRLNENLDMVELIKLNIVQKQKTCRKAIIVSSIVGVFVGIILSALSPIFSSFVLNSLTLGNEAFNTQVIYTKSILYSLISLCIIVSSLVTFDITKSLNFSNTWVTKA